ncbi:DUF6527 family protein [Streptomyces sp. MUM 16J]|uniref:DUF6527 family protein n=1 Tax=Streptomyces sp. MUM 16J TaxID=2791988 RepID=UPI001F03C324|nr:DUF6527 family protein [Streptomyces sp. MUM 16J]MCH0561160.1 hypothetical protein [Streptomyces sp. MUM 16J]
MTDTRITHVFVDCFPERLDQGMVYISIRYALVTHLCCCGCGYEVVTPLAPREWKLTFDGDTISLHPSIGNWSFPCKSHYWIRNNTVVWARQRAEKEISAIRGTTHPTAEAMGGMSPRGTASSVASRWWAALRKHM